MNQADTLTSYRSFIATKRTSITRNSCPSHDDLQRKLFPFQKPILGTALERGKCAHFLDCGLGKTIIQLSWSHHVARHTGGKVLILAPLGVALQTVAEGDKFGLPCTYSRDGSMPSPVTVTNYEMMDAFDDADIVGVVPDESGILKNFSGVIRNKIINRFAGTHFKLACTATPSPNDFMELGNHAEFLGVMKRSEMLARFFTHDGGDTSKWRLKGHARRDFWQWVAQWAVICTKPSDLGFSDEGYILPPLNMHRHIIPTPTGAAAKDGRLFAELVAGLSDRREVVRDNAESRAELAADLIDDSAWVIWCEYNKEADAYSRAIEGSVDLCGSLPIEQKQDILKQFASGEIKRVITKPKIAGFGMNWQHCNNMIGRPWDSYENLYQCIRRSWRFGQTRPVNFHLIAEERELSILENVERKQAQHIEMIAELLEVMHAA